MRGEFYGVSRQRSGVAERHVQAGTLGELLGTLAAEYPSLAELISENRLHPALAANLNGDRFVRDPLTPLEEHDCLLILSADAGG
jgi:molybdopterin converting factor small subunit